MDQKVTPSENNTCWTVGIFFRRFFFLIFQGEQHFQATPGILNEKQRAMKDSWGKEWVITESIVED